MLIGELAEKTGATVRMLRYYDQHGLLTPQRTQGRYRVYDESDVERVRSVRCLISSGLNIRLVRLVLAHAFDQDVQLPEDEAGCVPLLEMLTEELTSVEARIAQLNSSKAHLTRLVGDVTRIMEEKFGDRPRCRDSATEEAPGTSAEGLHSGRRPVRA